MAAKSATREQANLSPPGCHEAFALADPGDMAVTHLTIAGRPAVIVDGLYADPAAARRIALSLNFEGKAGLHPGRFASVAIEPHDQLALLNTLLAPRLNRSLVPSPYYRDLTFAVMTTPPQALEPLQRQPHFDTFCDFAGVVYLGPTGPSEGGTSFWRHQRTGLERAPGERSAQTAEATLDLRRLMLEGLTSLSTGYPVATTVHWEMTQLAPLRLNRLVAYDARVFRAPHVTRFEPPDDPERARITQNLFLDFAP